MPIADYDNAGKQRVGESQHKGVVEHLHSTLSSQNKRKNRNLPDLQNYQLPPGIQLLSHSSAGVMREKDLPFVSILTRYNAAPSLRHFYVFRRICTRRPGCYHGAWSSWHSEVVSLHLKSWTSLSALFAFSSIIPCERAQRAEACRTLLLLL